MCEANPLDNFGARFQQHVMQSARGTVIVLDVAQLDTMLYSCSRHSGEPMWWQGASVPVEAPDQTPELAKEAVRLSKQPSTMHCAFCRSPYASKFWLLHDGDELEERVGCSECLQQLVAVSAVVRALSGLACIG